MVFEFIFEFFHITDGSNFWISQIQAHKSPLAAMAFSSDGLLLATASDQGTVIRVHSIPQASKVNMILILIFSAIRLQLLSLRYRILFASLEAFQHI